MILIHNTPQSVLEGLKTASWRRYFRLLDEESSQMAFREIRDEEDEDDPLADHSRSSFTFDLGDDDDEDDDDDDDD